MLPDTLVIPATQELPQQNCESEAKWGNRVKTSSERNKGGRKEVERRKVVKERREGFGTEGGREEK